MDVLFQAGIGGSKHEYGVPSVNRRIYAWIRGSESKLANRRVGSKRGYGMPSVDMRFEAWIRGSKRGYGVISGYGVIGGL